jgi:geranylgeranyl reductase family protein
VTRAYDAVIMGGGPAGSAAAYTLASRGHRVCLVDKSVFPRDKLCGGLVTLRSKKLFESIFERTWDDSLFIERNGVTFYDRHTRIGAIENYSRLFLTMRYDFDKHLLDRACAAGADAMLGAHADNIDVAASRLTVDGEEITYRYLIGADGVNSQVARALYGRPFDTRNIGFALETEVPREATAEDAVLPEVFFGAISWGYGWVFPKRKTLTVGIGGFHRYNPEMRRDLDALMAARGFGDIKTRVKGHFIPFGHYRRPPGRGNVLLTGDAAGFVDSLSGEGIGYAMQSGHAAAAAVSDALRANAPEDALVRYAEAAKPIARAIRQSNIARWFVYAKAMERIFIASIPNAHNLQRRFLDILAGEKSYDNVPYLLARHFVKGIANAATGKNRARAN